MVRRAFKPVHISVHPAFFEKLEFERKNLERRTNKNFTHIQLTEALAQSKVRFPTMGGDIFNAIEKTKQKRRRY